MEAFVGTWKMTQTENFDEYMKAIGVGFMIRKMAATVKPEQVISVNGDEMEIQTKSSVKNSTLKFKLDVEFDNTTPDGRKVKTLVTKEGDKLKQVDKEGEKVIVVYREIINGEYVMTMEFNGIKCIRKYTCA